MSLSGKALGVKIVIANTIALILYAFIANTGSAAVGFQSPEAINGTPTYNPQNFNVQYEQPKVGISIIDALLAFYFVFSYGVAAWLILNPVSG